MNPFEGLSEEVGHLLHSLAGPTIWGPFTKYSLFLIIIFALVLIILFSAKKQLVLVPKNRFMGFIEFFVDFAKTQFGTNVLGDQAKKHLPFLMTLFAFILLANIVGVIPGSTAATGTMGTTFALTLISFIYFTYYGIRHHGLGKYILSYIPHVKPTPLAWFVGTLEFVSMLLRLLTLSVRLFANMFAGHILLGVLAILSTLFFMPMIESFSAATLGMGAGSIAWVLFLTIMYAMEIFVALLQAYVFTLLSSVYLSLATTEH